MVGTAAMAEVTVSPLMPGPHLSAGVDAGRGEGYGYAEVAFSLIVTVGVGVGYRFISPEAETNGARLHLTLSMQIPLRGWTRWYDGSFRRESVGISLHGSPALALRLLYLGPFIRWRQKFDRSGEDRAFGALLKFSFGQEARKRETPR